MEQLVGAPINDEEAMNRFYERLEEEAQIATAECMLQQGFEFTPIARVISPMEASGLSEDSIEFAERFGFGIATDLVVNELNRTAGEDPLEQHLKTLTDGERQAYETALFGPPTQEREDRDSWGAGCYGDSYEAAYAKSPDRVFDLLEEEAMEVLAQYFADPRMVEAQKAYAECMSTKGYEYQTADKAKVAIAGEVGEILSDESSFVDPFPADERGEIGMGWNDESVEFQIAGSTLTPAGQELVDLVAGKEFAVAIVSAECIAPQRTTELEVQFEYEQILVDQLGDQVRAIMADE